MAKIDTLLERLATQSQRCIRLGKEASQKEIAKNMLNKKLDDKMILEMTGIKKEELEEIKSKLQVAG